MTSRGPVHAGYGPKLDGAGARVSTAPLGACGHTTPRPVSVLARLPAVNGFAACVRRRGVGGEEKTATWTVSSMSSKRGRGAADTYAPDQQARLGFAE